MVNKIENELVRAVRRVMPSPAGKVGRRQAGRMRNGDIYRIRLHRNEEAQCRNPGHLYRLYGSSGISQFLIRPSLQTGAPSPRGKALVRCLETDLGHDSLQGGLHGVGIGQLGGGFAAAVTAVDRFVMGQDAKEL